MAKGKRSKKPQNLYRRANGVWYCVYRDEDGKRQQKPIRTTDLLTAVRQEAQRRVARQAPHSLLCAKGAGPIAAVPPESSACDAAEVPAWNPHRIRHSAATYLREEFGLEVASLILGHSDVEGTRIYAERNQAKALEVTSQWG